MLTALFAASGGPLAAFLFGQSYRQSEEAMLGFLFLLLLILLPLSYKIAMEKARNPKHEVKVYVENKEPERETYVLVPEHMVKQPAPQPKPKNWKNALFGRSE